MFGQANFRRAERPVLVTRAASLGFRENPGSFTLQLVAKRRNAVNQICGRRESHTSGITIYFNNRELADRVAKAFQHLLRISGGKDEPF